MNYDDYYTPAEIRLIESLKGKSFMQKDEIIGEYENGYIVRNDNTGN